MLVEQCPRRDQKAGRADTALQGGVFEELLLQRMQPLRPGQALNGRHRLALDLDAEDETGVDQPAIEDDVARAAVAVVAAFLAAGQPQLVAQHFKETLARLAEEL